MTIKKKQVIKIPSAAEALVMTQKGVERNEREKERLQRMEEKRAAKNAEWENRVILPEIEAGVAEAISQSTTNGKREAFFSHPQGNFRRLCDLVAERLRKDGYKVRLDERTWPEEVDSPGGSSCSIIIEW